ncbi:MAG TPA: serine hydrolase, partial [Ferruginibacter sp.]|nr:serine hydrolase [Ferruginibacter sp.]
TTAFRSNYGYGWFIDSLSARQIISHSGGAAGFRTYLIRIPADNICIVLLGNAENIDVAAIKNNLLHILFGEPYKLPVNIPISKSRLTALEGTYQIEPGRSMYVTRMGSRLIAQVSGQQATLLLAQNNQKFLVDGMNDGWLEFKYGKNAFYDTVFLFRKGKKYTGVKIQAGWGLAGSALAGGWNGPDLRLQRTGNESNIWKAENVRLNDGVIKFRYNNDWTLNYGIMNGFTTLTAGGKDIPVATGIYTITIDVSDPDKVTYLIEPVKKK